MLLTVRAAADETASLDNSQAITESPQSQPPGFQVNPPVHDNTADNKWCDAQDELNPDSKTRSNWNPSQATGFVAATVLF